MFKIYDGRSEFFQWDLDRKLIVSDPTIDEVHFCNKTDNCSLVCEVYEEGGLHLVNVPNILLQNHWDINVFGYCDKCYTKQHAKFKVKARSKPTDYVYTETEVKNWEDLEKKIDDLKKDIDDDYVKQTQIAQASGDYGLVKIGAISTGLEIQSNGQLAVRYARATDLKNKSNSTVVTSYNVGCAVKEGLIDPDGSGVKGEWTETDQALARQTLGIDTELTKYVQTPTAVPQGYQTVLGYAAKGTTPTLWATGAYATEGAAGVIAKYNTSGRLMSAEPVNDTDVATKGYVDSKAGGAGGKTAYMHIFKLLDNQTPTSYYRVYISMKTSELQGFNAFEGYDMSEEVSFLVSGWDYDSGILNNIKIKQEMYDGGEYAGYAIETLNGFSRICAENFTIISEDII